MAKKSSLKRLKDNIDYLALLSKAKRSEQRRKLIEIATADQLNAVWDCIHNILFNERVPLTQNDRKKLKKYKNILVSLDRLKKSHKEKKKDILHQHGGFLPALLAPVLGIAGTLLSNLLTR